ncbi:methionyl-tRNA formyltransferase [Flavimarina sp. Hel_I_48]|uniref:methionyl-tRNA formyltransferase n=1 Tax=Flavimarina sp. Hel_I_48 TaxID=1392488 RepID=UPI0004DFB9FF|nr:methionyl-tRNA formyltransferase [Flavimarina sp. Hel_I_48]
MTDLRIVFMGTPDFAVASLRAIITSGANVVGVITAPDRPAGRGQKLSQSAVKVYAQKQNLPILQPVNLKSPDFLDALKDLNANLQVVVAFRMLPKEVWQMPALGTFNLHASLLPNYRGAAPINWAIINGEKTTGVTTFFIDEKIDTGAIIKQQEVSIGKGDNAGVLHDQLMEAGSTLILETLEDIKNGTVKTQPQPQTEKLNTAYKLDRENTRIDWNKPTSEIYDHIRGLSPYPVAWTSFTSDGKEQQMKIYAAQRSEPEESIDLDRKQLKVIDGCLFVGCSDGILEITRLQLAGKRKMSAKDLLNGYSFDKDAKVL